MNIAGFNGGIALGSLLGGASLEAMGLTSTAWVGVVAVDQGIVWMLWQMRRPTSPVRRRNCTLSNRRCRGLSSKSRVI